VVRFVGPNAKKKKKKKKKKTKTQHRKLLSSGLGFQNEQGAKING